MAIVFKGVNIRRDYFGKLNGELEIDGDYGSSRLNLTDELCKSILELCADSIVQAASDIAENMKSEAAQINVVSGQAIELEGESK